VVMMPCGWLLGSRLGLGVNGLFAAILAGSIVSSVLLSVRFRVLSVRNRHKILRASPSTTL